MLDSDALPATNVIIREYEFDNNSVQFRGSKRLRPYGQMVQAVGHAKN